MEVASPIFALYDNGALLCADKTGRHAVMLAPAERDEMLRALAVPSLIHAAGNYAATESTDQRSSDLYIWKSGCRAVHQLVAWTSWRRLQLDRSDFAVHGRKHHL